MLTKKQIKYKAFSYILSITAVGIMTVASGCSTKSSSPNQTQLYPGVFTVHKWSSNTYGVINGQGNVVIPFNEFSSIGEFSEGLAPAAKKGGKLMGYIDKSGKFVYKSRFFELSHFVDGVSYGTITSRDKEFQGMFVVIKETPHGLVVSDPINGHPFRMSERMVVFVRMVKVKYKRNTFPVHEFGVVNAGGKIVVKPHRSYIHIGRYSEGLASIEITKNDKPRCGYINYDGSFVIAPQYKWSGRFSEGLAAVKNDKGEWFYIDRHGHTVFKVVSKVQSAKPFSEGLAAVGGGPFPQSHWGYIGKHGKLRIPIKFTDVHAFHDGVARVGMMGKKSEKWGYINHSGEWLIKPKYDSASNFDRGLAHVRIGKWDGPNTHGFINRHGNWVWKTTEK